MVISHGALAFVLATAGLCRCASDVGRDFRSPPRADRRLQRGASDAGLRGLVSNRTARSERQRPSILVDVWYPAEPSLSEDSPRGEYLDVAAFERALGNDRLRKHLGGAYDFIKAGGVRTHAVVRGGFVSSLRLAPVLLFSPGGGMIKELYASQVEDLASHGYVVAAMTHSYDGFLALFPDKSYVAFDSRRWPRIPSVEGEANLNQLEWHTEDILVVLNHLDRINRRSSSHLPFAGHLDLTRVGAFGHSFGGVAAAHACQKEQRIRACLNQDGAMGMKPFYLDVRGWGMNQAFMLMERPPNRGPLSDADLSELRLTRARAMNLIGRLNADRDRTMRNNGTGSYRVLLRREVTTHGDFSDLQVLTARNNAELALRLRVLMLIRSYTRAFFDRHVRGMSAALLDHSTPDGILESVERFGPAQRPN